MNMTTNSIFFFAWHIYATDRVLSMLRQLAAAISADLGQSSLLACPRLPLRHGWLVRAGLNVGLRHPSNRHHFSNQPSVFFVWQLCTSTTAVLGISNLRNRQLHCDWNKQETNEYSHVCFTGASSCCAAGHLRAR
jgi:hypothetical protein